MPEASIDQTDVAEAVYDAMKALAGTIEGIGAAYEYEYLPTDGGDLPCFGHYTLTGDPVERMYLDGTYLSNYRFQVILRQGASDSRSRLDAVKVLRSLADAFVAGPIALGDGCKVAQRKKETLPSRILAEASYVDYQVTLSVQYKAHL